ncbi:hypothetical protein HHI36_013732 [Cryptolaemus montrouzieri]|uniref:Uncharacterized protein n=1 Tax=Cryptolaemus montrouzieri TaxID=559131 RepID=A0ABD2NIJ1_9CUCU
MEQELLKLLRTAVLHYIQHLLKYVDAEELKNFIDAETTPDGNTSLHVACKMVSWKLQSLY